MLKDSVVIASVLLSVAVSVASFVLLLDNIAGAKVIACSNTR